MTEQEERDTSAEIAEQRHRSAAAAPLNELPGAEASHRRLVWLAMAVALAAVAYIAWRLFFGTPSLPESIVALSGRIEGDESAISPKVTGRILEIPFREGDSVNAEEIIAVLSDDQLRAREEQARAAVSAVKARSKSARDQIAVLKQQLRQNQLQTAQSKLDAGGA